MATRNDTSYPTFSECNRKVVTEHDMKAYGAMRMPLHPFLTLIPVGGMFRFMFRPLYPGNAPASYTNLIPDVIVLDRKHAVLFSYFDNVFRKTLYTATTAVWGFSFPGEGLRMLFIGHVCVCVLVHGIISAFVLASE